MINEKLGNILSVDLKTEEITPDVKLKLVESSLLVLPMFTTLPTRMQARIFEPSPLGQRKCVVSTNVAETSITVENIKYVIDSGFSKTNVFNPRVGMDSLRIVPISQAAANQRAGRAGRTAEGYCYHLFSDIQFQDEMLRMNVPEIQRTNLSSVVLLLKSLGVENPLDFDFMDPPPVENLAESMQQLWVLGALDDFGALTSLGRRMVDFPLEPSLSKMLLIAEKYRCSAEVLTIVSLLSSPEIFFRPQDRADEADAARERLIVPESDHLTMLNVYNNWKRNGKSSTWCMQHFVHFKALRRANDIRDQLLDVMRKEGIVESIAGPMEWTLVRRCVCSSYFPNSAQMKGIGVYLNMLNGLPVYVHPSSSLFGLSYTPEYVVYHELVLTSKEYLRQVTAIDGEWLAEYGPKLFYVKGMDAKVETIPCHQQKKLETSTPLQLPKVEIPSTSNDSDADDLSALALARQKRNKRGA